MPGLSDMIENFIKEELQKKGQAQIQRNELAGKFKCVPSQINYVITTRFSKDHGYFVESKRGGGGYIVIKQINIDNKIDYLMHVVMSMDRSVSRHTAEIYINNFLDYGVITEREAELLKSAVSDKVLIKIVMPDRDIMRSELLKNMLMGLLSIGNN